MELKIAYGDSRLSKRWINKKITFDELCEKFKATRRTTETVAEYKKFTKNRRDTVKDVGGFVLGHLKGGRRKKDTVESRSGITLDADHADVGFADTVAMLFQHKCAIYSTHSHTPDDPRLRVVIPLAREVSPDEYAALSRLVAETIGMDYFDDSTYEPERLMYWPSTPSDGDYIYKEIDGDVLDPDAYLAKLSDWRDCSLWPTSSRQSEIIKREITRQQDPLEKEGVVGAFCRAYPIEDAISVFLPDVYEPSVVGGRYDYIPADSSAGVVLYDGKFSYSHHASDPACGRLMNAFDLVRVHKFSGMDEKESFKAMSDLAITDELVKADFAKRRQAQAVDDFDTSNPEEWVKRLTINKDGTTEPSLENLVLIFENDSDFTGLGYNEFKRRLEFTTPPPWDNFAYPSLIDSDISEIRVRISRKYGLYSPTKTHDAMTRVAARRGFHPVRDFLDNLPEWDEIPRVDTLLSDYLGADDCSYTRTVTRKIMCAAVARIYHPGIKFDHVLVMDGMQGKGKSTMFNMLAGDEWYNDSLSLTDMQDKAGAEKLQGYWINEIGELAGMRKADIDKVKAFTSRKDDIYRPSYGRVVESHPRQCVIVATVNGDNRGYLRDTTGNRRFWPVKCTGSSGRKPWDITDYERLQIWAEAKCLWENGEKLYLDNNISALAAEKQLDAMEVDPREGMVEEFLNALVPDGWNEWSRERRASFYCDSLTSYDEVPEGKVPRVHITIAEVWVECFGNGGSKAKRQDSNEIAAILRRLGWESDGQTARVADYGKQQLWTRRNANSA